MKPKSIPTRIHAYRGSEGYTGITTIITTRSTAKNEISETVVVNDPTTNPIQTISESVAVVIT